MVTGLQISVDLLIIRTLKFSLALEFAMANSSVVSRKLLVINRNYQPVTTTTLKRAINKLFSNKAVVVLPPGPDSDIWREMSWSEWAKFTPRDGESVIKSAKKAFKIPEIVKVINYGESPRRKVKLSRRAIFKRDSHTCQYCGKSVPKELNMDDLTIDHCLPKSRSGKTEWSNVVLACYKCNRKKQDLTPEEAHMPLLSVPKPPPDDIFQGTVIRIDSWKHFLGDCYWETPLKE